MKLTFYDANGAVKTSLASIPAHTHIDASTGGQLNAGNVFSAGTVKHEYGGLEADVSAYSGYPKISGGSTSAVATIPIADGGTGQTGATAAFDALAPTTTNGDLIYHNGSDNVRLAVGAAGKTLKSVGGIPAWADLMDVIVLRDEKAQNTAGGTFTSGAWRTRDLNVEATDTGSLCTLSSNEFTPSAGTYFIFASAPGYKVGQHQARLYNVTDTTVTIEGTSEQSSSSDNVATRSMVVGVFTTAGSKAYRIEHQSSATGTTTGFGLANNFTTEVYTIVYLFKVA